MEELYKVMDDLLEVEFQMKAGMDITERAGRVLYAGKRNRKIGC